MIVLLIGEVPHPLNADAARWLRDAIREHCVYDTGHARDLPARACLQLADAIADDLERGSSLGPIELGRLSVEGLLTYVLRDEPFNGDEDLVVLYSGLRRFHDAS